MPAACTIRTSVQSSTPTTHITRPPALLARTRCTRTRANSASRTTLSTYAPRTCPPHAPSAHPYRAPPPQHILLAHPRYLHDTRCTRTRANSASRTTLSTYAPRTCPPHAPSAHPCSPTPTAHITRPPALLARHTLHPHPRQLRITHHPHRTRSTHTPVACTIRTPVQPHPHSTYYSPTRATCTTHAAPAHAPTPHHPHRTHYSHHPCYMHSNTHPPNPYSPYNRSSACPSQPEYLSKRKDTMGRAQLGPIKQTKKFVQRNLKSTRNLSNIKVVVST